MTTKQVWRSSVGSAVQACRFGAGSMAVQVSIVATLACFSTAARADEPNLFEPGELATGAISVLIHSCMESSEASMPSWLPVTRARYCSCVADAARVEYRRSPIEPMPTWTQLRTCANWAVESYSFDGRTPFNPSELNSWTIFRLDQSCWAQNNLEARAEVAYCGCWVDALRSHGERPMVTPQEEAYCHAAAEQFVTYSTYPPGFYASTRYR
jgi:hypothetical protein